MSDFGEMIETISDRIKEEIKDYAYKHGISCAEAARIVKININGRTLPPPHKIEEEKVY